MKLIPDRSARTDMRIEDAQTTELRLALVMNGGVSLAVWMGGVAHELDLLRRASRGDHPSSVEKKDRDVFKKWQELAEASKKRVRIDVISGTSAGGLNGLLLATAIGRRSKLPDLKQMWEKSASLKALLPPPTKSDPKSVLNGEYLEQKISEALGKISEGPYDDETVSLFVTATALDGRCRVFKDGRGQQFDVRDHRRVYRLKNQPPRRSWKYAEKNGKWDFAPEPIRHFTPGNEGALLQAARATASFPAAFPPVSEEPLTEHRVRPDPEYGDPASCVMDGGVLNNAPFGPVLDEITKRRVDERPVERFLVYVVPSAARLPDEQVKDRRCFDVSPMTAGLSALNYPQEADFRSATEDLEERLQHSVRGRREKLFERLATEEVFGRTMHESALKLFDEYRRSRVNAVLLDRRVRRSNTQMVTPLVPPPEADKDAVSAILRENLCWFPSADEELTSRRLDRWRWGIVAAERLLQTLGHYMHDLLELRGGDGTNYTPEQRTELIEGAKEISDELRRTISVRDAYRSEVNRRWPSDRHVDDREVSRLIHQVFTDLEIPATLAQRVNRAAECYLQKLTRVGHGTYWRDPAEVISAYLTVEVLTQAFAPPAKVVEGLTPRLTFLRLGPDEMGPLFQEDWSTGLGERKLYGIRLRHFGAFISRDWRHSDFTWGRLDAAHHLLPLLLAQDVGSLREKELQRAILAAEELSGTQADSPVERMRKHLYRLASCTDAKLLADEKDCGLRQVGDNVLRAMVKSTWLRLMAQRLWHRTWAIWHRNHDKGLESAAKKALKRGLLAPLMFLTLLIATALCALSRRSHRRLRKEADRFRLHG
ncbi:patatin-like protein [Streptomyces lydicus]|uniref:patatin-like protein n=1 Tax=Streptomyces lydicus TaxID=47763 RepID=UPI003799D79E